MNLLKLHIIILICLIIFKLINFETFVDIDNYDINPKIMIEEATKLNLKYKILEDFPTKVLIYKGGKSVIITPMSYNFNKDQSRVLLARNKFKTYELFRLHNIPIPLYHLYNNITVKNLDTIYDQKYIKYPLVVKDVNGALGNNVFINITNKLQLINAVNTLLDNKKNDILMEQHIKGQDHRILLFNNEIIDVVMRVPAYIIGDGRNTISRLIDIKNVIRRNSRSSQIIPNTFYLDQRNLSIDSVLPKGKKLIVNPLTNFHQGSELKRVPIKYLHEDNINLFKNISKLMKLTIIGIDFISSDIGISHKKMGKINEVNGTPSIDLHYFADNKLKTHIHNRILKMYFNIN